MKKYDKNGTPLIMLNYYYQQDKKGLQAFLAKRKFYKAYKTQTEISQDQNILLKMGLISELKQSELPQT